MLALFEKDGIPRAKSFKSMKNDAPGVYYAQKNSIWDFAQSNLSPKDCSIQDYIHKYKTESDMALQIIRELTSRPSIFINTIS